MAIRNKAFSKVTTLSNKVAEVELSKETVELAGVKDLKKAIGSAEGRMKLIRKDGSNFDDARRNLVTTLMNSEDAAGQLRRVRAEFVSAANDLGVKADSVKEYQDATKKLEDIQGVISMYERILK